MKGLTAKLLALSPDESADFTIMPPKPDAFRKSVYVIAKRHNRKFSCNIVVRQKLATVTRLDENEPDSDF